MSEARGEKIDSPWRNTSVEENLKLFEHMRQGRYAEGECSLRVKMDMQHVNPCMRDFVAYRIRYTPHPHSGDAWCIYPTYDYTHCIVDSLENITHSLCTLEFEVRRESYFQLLKDCDIYKPYVWEYSRLNVSNTVLSKRKIEELVNSGACNNWNDPRLLTLEGLRRRGYTPSMINDFCAHLGVARKGNENITSIKLLEKFARTELDRLAPRTFGVMEPILLEITNLDKAKDLKIQAPLFPADPTKGTQTYTLTKNVYIEAEDFSEKHVDKFFGLTPQQPVMLKYGPCVKFVSAEKNADGSLNHVKVEILPDYAEKLKGYLQWVSKEHSVNVTANLYAVHFLIEDIKKAGDKWLDYINPESLVVKSNAKIWDMHKKNKVDDRF
jgi:glutaminyl-tRNA synthetase